MTGTAAKTTVTMSSQDGLVRVVVTVPAVPPNTAEQSWSGLRWAIRQTLQDAIDWVELIARDQLPDGEYCPDD